MSDPRGAAAGLAYLLGGALTVGALALTPATSCAAAAAAAETSETSENVGLAEVLVTAQRKEENLQKVPIAVDTVSGADLEARGSTDFKSITASVPNVTSTGSTNQSIYIRGVGNTSASPNENSAATYVDGVYYASLQGLESFEFNNIERVEVLKGPQGTLFGRNTTAGVIQIITPDPKHEVGGKVNLGYGNFNTVQASGYLTGGLTDTLAADISLLYDDQMDGWAHNLTTGQDSDKHSNISARSKWLYTPADSTRVTASVDFGRFLSDGGNYQMMPGSVNALDHFTTYYGKYNYVGDDTLDNQYQYGAMVRLDQDFGSLHGVSITSFRHIDGIFTFDGDQTAARVLPQSVTHDSIYRTQEFQLSNNNPGRVTWLVGAFYYGNSVKNVRTFTGSGQAALGGFNEVEGRQRIQSGSVFGQTTIEVVDATKLTLGARYTDEKIQYDGFSLNGLGTRVGPLGSDLTSHPVTYRVALDRQFTPDLLGYVSFNRGFKSGGYNLSSVNAPAFNPEVLYAYETGLKAEMLDHRIRLNTAFFYYNFRNIQVVTVPGNGIQIFTNAAAARNYGVDASLDFAATQHLTLSTGVGLLSAKYTDYPGARTNGPNGQVIIVPNAKGNYLASSPPFTGFVSGQYRVPTAIGDLAANATVSYSGHGYFTPDDGQPRDAYTLVSGALEWWQPGASKPFGVRLWGRNLLNTYYAIDRIASGRGWYQLPAQPRTYGVTLIKEF